MFHLQDFPLEILFQIVRWLKGKDILNVISVSKIFYNICNQNSFWKNKILQEFPLLPSSRNPRRQYLEQYFTFLTVILLEKCYRWADQIISLVDCKTEFLLVDVSSNEKNAISNIKEKLLIYEMCIVQPKTSILLSAYSACLNRPKVEDLLNEKSIKHHQISKKVLVRSEDDQQEYYKYIVFGRWISIGPKIIFGLVVTSIYYRYDTIYERRYTQNFCAFIDFFQTKNQIMKFIRSRNAENLAQQLYDIDQKLDINSEIHLYTNLIKLLPEQLHMKNSAHFYKKCSKSSTGKTFSTDIYFEIVSIPIQNQTTLVTALDVYID